MSEKTQEQKDADALVKKYGVPTWDHDCREHQDTLDGSPAVVESFGSAKFGAEGPAEDPYIRIKFQAGPLPDGVNGCSIEDVIDVLVTRLEGFQKGPFRCRENALAITKLEEAKLWLSERTRKRQTQGVEGTMAAHI